MRLSRSLQLWPDQATVHLYWRCHNREFYLEDLTVKDLYMKCLSDGLKYKDQYKHCKIHGFCAMSNHFHQIISYNEGSKKLSDFMRYAHSLFGARYNRREARSGKVAEGRPKTPRIQDDYHQMRVHFYIEANPIRAKFRTLENLKFYIYSSYGFYAYGIKTKFTWFLTIPGWYIRLGKTYRERQRKYRKLFEAYIKEYNENNSVVFKKNLIGDILWLEDAKEKLRLLFSKKYLDFSNPDSLSNST